MGFALVTRPRIAGAGESSADFHMAEFFIRKQYRRSGAGRDAATLIFDRFAGEWEILEYQRNPGAVAFWRRVVADYSRGQFHGKDQQRRNTASVQEPARNVRQET